MTINVTVFVFTVFINIGVKSSSLSSCVKVLRTPFKIQQPEPAQTITISGYFAKETLFLRILRPSAQQQRGRALSGLRSCGWQGCCTLPCDGRNEGAAKKGSATLTVNILHCAK
jgi:hypothetical protein